MRPRQGLDRGHKDSVVRQNVQAQTSVWGTIGHAPFVAEAGPAPCKEKTSALWVMDGADRKQGLAVVRPRYLIKTVWICSNVGRSVPAQVFEGGSVQDVDSRDIIVANRHPLAVRAKGYAARAISARRFERLAHAAKVGAVAGSIVRVASNQPVKGRRHEPTVGGKNFAP